MPQGKTKKNKFILPYELVTMAKKRN